MTKVRRLLAVLALCAAAAWVTSYTLGQTASKKAATGKAEPGAQLPSGAVTKTASAPKSAADDETPDRFAPGGVVSYQPVQGDLYFALQLQPKLDPAKRRPRDFVIVVSKSATQAGPQWVAARQIVEAVVETAGDYDRVSIWVASDPKGTVCLTGDDFLSPKDRADAKKITDVAIKKLRDKDYPTGAVDLKDALDRATGLFLRTKDAKDARQLSCSSSATA